jgi:hypothetical protein
MVGGTKACSGEHEMSGSRRALTLFLLDRAGKNYCGNSLCVSRHRFQFIHEHVLAAATTSTGFWCLFCHATRNKHKRRRNLHEIKAINYFDIVGVCV